MSEHLTESDATAYRARTTSPEQFVDISNHIFTCDECYRRVDSPQKVRAAYEAIKKLLNVEEFHWFEHLDYKQLADFTDEKMSKEDREFVLSHAKVCERCSGELDLFAKIKVHYDIAGSREAELKRESRAKPILKTSVDSKVLGLAILVLLTSIMSLIYLHWSRSRIETLRSERNDLSAKLAEYRSALVDGGHHFGVDARGDLFGAEGLAADYRDAIRDALTTGHISIPPAPQTGLGKIGPRRGISTREVSSDVLSPVGIAVQETRPTFEWKPLQGATSYTVFIRDLATREVIDGKPTSKTTWTSEKDLARGREYAWMVETYVHGKPVRIPSPDNPFPAFRVLSSQQVQEIESARKSWGDSHLVMGLVYAKTGLLREAQKEFEALAAANPNSAAAQRLLADVQGGSVSSRPNK